MVQILTEESKLTPRSFLDLKCVPFKGGGRGEPQSLVVTNVFGEDIKRGKKLVES